MIPWLADKFIASLQLPKWYDVAILKMEDLPTDIKTPDIMGIRIAAEPPKASQVPNHPEEVFVIGCPSGMPLKCSSGVILGDYVPPGSTVLSPSRFSTTLEQFKGSFVLLTLYFLLAEERKIWQI
jgi:hypothetical protein